MTETLSLLGSTGSIGRQTLDVCREQGIRVAALAAGRSVDLLEAQAREFRPRLAVLYDMDAALELASRSRGTPRIANRLLKRVRDFAQVMSGGVITLNTAQIALERMEIDELGLDQSDRNMLAAIIKNYGGGPVGLETLAAAIGEEAVTIEDVNEPYLMQLGFLTRTPRGRCVTPAACAHLGLPLPSRLRAEEELQMRME